MAAAKVGGILANSKNQESFLLENLKIQNSIFEASVKSGIENFIFLGSSCIYPKFAKQPISEESLLSGKLEETNEGYALAKITGLRLCKAIFEGRGYNYFALMPANLYGPNDNFDLANSHVAAALMRRFHEAKISKNEQVTLWGTGKPRREFMHVDDLADACWYFIDRPMNGEFINIGTGTDISINKFARLVASITEFRGDIVFDTSKPDGTPRKLLKIDKAHSLGWSSKIDLEVGITATYDWFVENYERGDIRGL
jgi:GDP-L-fucose synthase